MSPIINTGMNSSTPEEYADTAPEVHMTVIFLGASNPIVDSRLKQCRHVNIF